MAIFWGRRDKNNGNEPAPAKIPPGQYLVRDFPVLSAGPTPPVLTSDWNFTIEHGNDVLGSWDWDAMLKLEHTDIQTDIHCVTRWSKLDTAWAGVTIDTFLQAAGVIQPPTQYLTFHCYGGYTTNLPVEDVLNAKGLIAHQYAGKPLPPAHGGPARLLVPHLYLWKSAKWVKRMRFVDEDTPGFWESYGYHMYGDPWREQRFRGD